MTSPRKRTWIFDAVTLAMTVGYVLALLVGAFVIVAMLWGIAEEAPFACD